MYVYLTLNTIIIITIITIRAPPIKVYTEKETCNLITPCDNRRDS